MRVKPKMNFKLLGTSITLNKTMTYEAVPATNQPDWEAKGLVFVNEMLLSKDDYDVIGEESKATPTMQFCWWA